MINKALQGFARGCRPRISIRFSLPYPVLRRIVLAVVPGSVNLTLVFTCASWLWFIARAPMRRRGYPSLRSSSDRTDSITTPLTHYFGQQVWAVGHDSIHPYFHCSPHLLGLVDRPGSNFETRPPATLDCLHT